MKFILYRWKDTNELYAWTTNKEYAKSFEESRCMKRFKKTKLELDDIEEKAFMYKNENHMLQQDYLFDGKTDIEVVCTREESAMLDEACGYIHDTISNAALQMKSYPLKKKYLKIIKKITINLTMQGEKAHGTLNINTFKLFIHLAGKSFGVTPIENLQEGL